MKKLFTLILILIGFSGFSQSLQLSWHYGPLPADAGIMITGDANMELTDTILVKNMTNNPLDVKLTKTEIQTFNGSVNYFCWKSCYSNTVYTSPDPLNIGPGQTRDNFTCHLMANGTFGTTIIRYTFFVANNVNDTASVTIVMISGAVGIDNPLKPQVELSKAYPNPATTHTAFNYSLPSDFTGKASLVISNLLGSKVMEIPVEGTNGRLNVSLEGLHKGVYFYSFVLNKESRITRKLVIE